MTREYERRDDPRSDRQAPRPSQGIGLPARTPCPFQIERLLPASTIQRAPAAGLGGGEGLAAASVSNVVHEPGRPLGDGTRAQMGAHFGFDFSSVQVHTDAAAARSARDVGARAYAVGRHVVFGEGQYAPESTAGRRLLAHELAHVIQQPPQLPAALRLAPVDDASEHEADGAAEQVVTGGLRAVPQAYVARKPDPQARKAPSFSGTLFLPGDVHVGHLYTIQGDKLVEKPDKAGDPPRVLATLDGQGNYYLADASGAATTAPSGKLTDLVGDVHISGPAPAPTQTKSSGHFSVKGADGKPIALSIRDGGVYTADKQPRLVGSITATGEYAVRLGETVVKGSIEQMPAGEVAYQGARTVEGKAQPGLSIQPEGLTIGSAVLGGTKFRIKSGRLYRDGEKEPAGEISVVRTGSGQEQVTRALPYRYTDDKDKPVTGDLLRDAGEQSYYHVGGQYRVRVGGAWIDPGALRNYHGHVGFDRTGGGKLTDRLKQLRDKKLIASTDAEIAIFQGIATAEAGGHVQQINTYDDAVLSFGFKQWTYQEKSEVPALIAKVPEAFKRYGIELGGEFTIKGKKVPGIKGVSDPEDLRGSYWSARFYEAGLDDEIIAAEVAKAGDDLAGLRSTIRRSSHLEGEAALDLLLELQNNRPAYIASVVGRTLPRIPKESSEDAFLEVFVDEIVRAYAEDPDPKRNGGRDGGIEKSLRWTGKLLRNRGHKSVAERVETKWKTPKAASAAPAAAPQTTPGK